MGYNLTIIASAMSLIFPIGDCLPPSRITGRLSCEVVGYEGSYGSFLKAVLIPCLILAAVALVMMVFPDKFAFLVL
jgi:CitMHS family citrate-Mg2+:H+ or citrate-Ca2+:H+ symporter